MTNTAQQFCSALQESHGINYEAEFVPFSQSRNGDESTPSLNWRVSISQNGHQLKTDYMQGIAHLPNYSHAFANLVVYDDALREAAETGKSKIIKAKNGYDAAQADRMIPRAKTVPAPELADVLYALVMDADVLNYADFEDWAESFGYDTDSRKAEKIYHACMENALKLRQLIDLDEAAKAFEDY